VFDLVGSSVSDLSRLRHEPKMCACRRRRTGMKVRALHVKVAEEGISAAKKTARLKNEPAVYVFGSLCVQYVDAVHTKTQIPIVYRAVSSVARSVVLRCVEHVHSSAVWFAIAQKASWRGVKMRPLPAVHYAIERDLVHGLLREDDERIVHTTT
jgi:hypothetical protein